VIEIDRDRPSCGVWTASYEKCCGRAACCVGGASERKGWVVPTSHMRTWIGMAAETRTMGARDRAGGVPPAVRAGTGQRLGSTHKPQESRKSRHHRFLQHSVRCYCTARTSPPRHPCGASPRAFKVSAQTRIAVGAELEGLSGIELLRRQWHWPSGAHGGPPAHVAARRRRWRCARRAGTCDAVRPGHRLRGPVSC